MIGLSGTCGPTRLSLRLAPAGRPSHRHVARHAALVPTWQALLNNFAIERAAFTGVEIGILQSLREVPGFLAFTVVFALILMREQTFAFVSLLVLGIGTAITGFFPTVVGLYATTVLMSIGYHYFESVRQSLALQWTDKEHAPHFLGRMIAATSLASLVAFALIYLALDIFGLAMRWVYLLGGGITAIGVVAAWIAFPRFEAKVEQHQADRAPRPLLALLRVGVHVGGPAPDLRRLRRLPDGREVRVRRRRDRAYVSRQRRHQRFRPRPGSAS